MTASLTYSLRTHPHVNDIASIMAVEQAVIRAFLGDAPIANVRRHGHGLINDTYVVTGADGRHILLQRLNTQVFPHPEWVMENLRIVSDHWHRAADRATGGSLQLPAIIPTRAGFDWVRDGNGGFWRAQEFLEATETLEVLPHERHATEVGAGLGRFHARLRDLSPARLHVTLPGFHDTPGYFVRLLRAATRPRARSADRTLRRALAFVQERRRTLRALQLARRAGTLQSRTVHGDTKLNNFLFDRNGTVVSLIDLDTVQPGLVHYDLGDCLRSCANPGGEEAADPETVDFDFPLGRAVLQGYFAAAGTTLSATDCAHIYEAIRLIPLELGMRFLTDHLEGDRYFKTDRPGQNLERALVQFRLTAGIERRESDLRRLISDLAPREKPG